MKKKYEMIIEYIEKLVEKRQIKQGERLPSIRDMVNKFKCNKSTVIRAYKELEINHKIYSIPKSGYYLVENKNINNDKVDIINFSEVMPEPKLLPYKEFNHCINKAIELNKDNLFTYSKTQGIESLRKVLEKHFSENQIFTSYEKIVITSGAQQAINILSKMPFPNNKKNILVEQPTYRLINRLAELNKNKLIGIDRDYEGINLKKLEHIFKTDNIKFFYTIPRFHNPLGTHYSEKIKMKIVELADKYDVYIVEDDYLADIDNNKKFLPLYYYDTSQKVIYVKSFSKSFMPGIRIGAVVLHDNVKKIFLDYKECFDLNTSVLAQGALEIFINSGMYKNHIKKAKIEYKRKMDIVRDCLDNIDQNEVEYYIPETGFFIWMKLPQCININMLVQRLKSKDVYITPADDFYIRKNPQENSFRICISKLNKNQIRKGIRILFDEVKKQL